MLWMTSLIPRRAPLVRFCHLSEGRNPVMRSRSFSSRRACSRSQSQMRRWISGRGKRLRSGRGGKSPAGASPPGYLLPLLPLLLDQEAVGEHHQDAVAVEAGPQPALVLVPAQQPLGLLVELLHPVAPVRVLRHRRQGRLGAEVAPVVLPLVLLALRRPLPYQPAGQANAFGRLPPAPQRAEPRLQPALGALAPVDRLPVSLWQLRQHRLGVRSRPARRQRHREVLADRRDVTLLPFLQAGQEVGVVAV